MSTTRITHEIKAPRARVFRALLDARRIERWKVPTGMTCRVHEFEVKVGGRFRVSLTYDTPSGTGKTDAQSDTYHGYFEKLVPDTEVVEIMEFETGDPELKGEMRITTSLSDIPGGGTMLTAIHEGLPEVVSVEDNELGWRISLEKLAALVEGERD